MKRKFTLIALTIFIATILFAGCSSTKQASDTSLADIKSKGKFVVGLDDGFPPMGFRDEKNNLVGFDIDLAKEAAKRMGVVAEFKPVEWDGITLSLNNKDIDVIWNGLTITEERKKQISYTKPYLNNRQIIAVLANSNIKTKADLAGKVIATQLGSSSEEAIAADKDTKAKLKEIKTFDKFPTALAELKSGRAKAVVIDELVGRYYMAKEPGVYVILNEDFGKETLGVGVRQTDTTFLNELNKVMDEMKADGTADKISKQWFGESIIVK